MLRIGIPVAGALLTIAGLLLVMHRFADGIDPATLDFSRTETGTLESAVSSDGRIVPAYEEVIVSPVGSRIREIFCHEGDSVEAGTPLLRLDLASTEDEYRRLADELAMKQNQLHQADLSGETRISDLEMQIKTKEMAVDRLHADYQNERRLDSIGSGTGERVLQARLAWQTGILELDQMRRQLSNERRIQQAASSTGRIEENISRRNLAQAGRTLEEAHILAPHSGTLTFIVSSIGATVGQGERLAVVSDLSHLKISGEAPEGLADRIAVGAPAKVRAGKYEYDGTVTHTGSQSKSGVVPFTVRLQPDHGPGLRAGISARVSVIHDVRSDVVRIRNASYYRGPGKYRLFVRTSANRLEARDVTLGDSNPRWVEVTSGLSPGEEVVISDMKPYEGRSSIRLR